MEALEKLNDLGAHHVLWIVPTTKVHAVSDYKKRSYKKQR